MTPYYNADGITLYHGDCRDVLTWLDADVLVTDPPYGIAWHQPAYLTRGRRPSERTKMHPGIQNDHSVEARDWAVIAMSDRPGLIFGSPLAPYPPGARTVLVWQKPADAGLFGSVGPWRRDWEAIFVVGKWPAGSAGHSSVISTRAGTHRAYAQGIHPHAKPLDVMQSLISACPPGVIADPFAGSGSTLLAARAQGRRAIGVEVEERYCDLIASRLAQGDLFGGAA